MRRHSILRQGAICGIVLVALAAFLRPSAAPAASANVAPIAPGAARIWFYRDYEPSVSLNVANVMLNGATTVVVQPDGSAVYRDVPAGRYHIGVDSTGTDVNQSKDVDLAPGQEAFVKVLALSSWDSGGDTISFQRDTFYVSLVPPQIARAQLTARPLSGG
jgi:hypothetical protein